jgi:hypothetical protein
VNTNRRDNSRTISPELGGWKATSLHPSAPMTARLSWATETSGPNLCLARVRRTPASCARLAGAANPAKHGDAVPAGGVLRVVIGDPRLLKKNAFAKLLNSLVRVPHDRTNQDDQPRDMLQSVTAVLSSQYRVSTVSSFLTASLAR